MYAKAKAVAVFEAELRKLRSAGRAPSLLLSSVTDPYQGAERRYRLTRGILEERQLSAPLGSSAPRESPLPARRGPPRMSERFGLVDG